MITGWRKLSILISKLKKGQSLQKLGMDGGSMRVVENSGKAVIRKGEPGIIIMHGVERLGGHELDVTYYVTSISDTSVGVVVVQHILYGDVLIFLVEPRPAPCDIEICWVVRNVKVKGGEG